MSEHTKGPWRWDTTNPANWDYRVLEADGNNVIDLSGVYPGYSECGEDLIMEIKPADAHLISACPDMYEALKKCESYMRIRQKNKSEFSKRTLADKLIEDAQAAITKAEGKP